MPSDTVLVGLCTGLLAAAAVSASQSTLDLVDNALNIVRVAFRIGFRVSDAAQRLSTEVNQRWSRLVLDVQKETSIAEIRQFNARKVRKFSASLLLHTPGSETLAARKDGPEGPRKERAPGRGSCPNLGLKRVASIIILIIELRYVLGFTAG